MSRDLAEGRITALYRHPIKGFTPEAVSAAELVAGRHFPDDRMYAVEIGPCGFDPDAPGHISKQKFAVIARMAEVAKVRTVFDCETRIVNASAAGRPDLAADLALEEGRQAFAGWLSQTLPLEADEGPLKVLAAPQGHRFMDHPRGMVSVLNLASVRDLAEKLGRPVDPLRFRANVHVEGWPAWIENTPELAGVGLGDVACAPIKPIVRCKATHVDPATGEDDIELTRALFDHYGHAHCGLYVEVVRGGWAVVGDRATAPETLH